VAPADLLLACKVDGVGPFFGHAGVDADGEAVLSHPWLVLEGEHRVTVRAQSRARPGAFSSPVDFPVVRDHTPPQLAAHRRGTDVVIEAWDNLTPVARVAVAAEVGAAGTRLGFAPRETVAAAPEQTVTLWARDDAGNVSLPVMLPGLAASPATAVSPNAPAGCHGAATCNLLAVALALAPLLRRRRRGGR
jgi:hypothetical protein